MSKDICITIHYSLFNMYNNSTIHYVSLFLICHQCWFTSRFSVQGKNMNITWPMKSSRSLRSNLRTGNAPFATSVTKRHLWTTQLPKHSQITLRNKATQDRVNTVHALCNDVKDRLIYVPFIGQCCRNYEKTWQFQNNTATDKHQIILSLDDTGITSSSVFLRQHIYNLSPCYFLYFLNCNSIAKASGWISKHMCINLFYRLMPCISLIRKFH